MGAFGTSVSWSVPETPQPGATFLGRFQYASIHDEALSDRQMNWLRGEYSSRSATCSTHFYPHGAKLATFVRIPRRRHCEISSLPETT